jgi:hypothetical protein
MTLEERLLQKLAEWHPESGRQTLTIAELTIADPASSSTVAITCDRSDLVASQLWEVALQRPVTLDIAAVRSWAEQTAIKVTGLLEPLRMLEVDTENATALLRSQNPTRRGENLFYYELTLNGHGRAHVARYQASAKLESRRQQISFALTHEALAKLVSDINSAL